MKGFTTPVDILKKFENSKDKFISQEFQKYGYDLAATLGDLSHKALYIKLAKTIPRSRLEAAKNFVKGATYVKSKPKLFLWKLGRLKKDLQKHLLS